MPPTIPPETLRTYAVVQLDHQFPVRDGITHLIHHAFNGRIGVIYVQVLWERSLLHDLLAAMQDDEERKAP